MQRKEKIKIKLTLNIFTTTALIAPVALIVTAFF